MKNYKELYETLIDAVRKNKTRVIDQMVVNYDDIQNKKRGKCPCGGYYQDWHSHASDCNVINSKGKQYGGDDV